MFPVIAISVHPRDSNIFEIKIGPIGVGLCCIINENNRGAKSPNEAENCRDAVTFLDDGFVSIAGPFTMALL